MKNANGQTCRCTGRCTCEWSSIKPLAERRTRHRRPINEWLIKKANRRIARAAEFYGIALPYKLRSRRSSRYNTTYQEVHDIPAVDLIHAQTGAVIVEDVDVRYWSGTGTNWNSSRSGRMVEQRRTVTRRHQAKDAPLIEWLKAGAVGTPPKTPKQTVHQPPSPTMEDIEAGYRRVDREIKRSRTLPVAPVVILDEYGNPPPTQQDLELARFEEEIRRVLSGAGD